MLIYVVVLVIIFLSSYFLKNNKKKFCIVTGVILWGLLAFRNISMGLNDTENVYYPFFRKILDMSFGDIFEYRFMSDKGFYILMKIISIFTNNYQICIAILAIPFVFFIMYGIYKYSEDPLLSTVIFVSLYYAYSFFLLRQVIAMGIMFYSYKYIKERNVVKFICANIIASIFHNTSLIFLIAYPICNYVKYGYKNYFAIIICYIIGKNIFGILIQVISNISILDRYMYSISNGYYATQKDFSVWGLIITVLILITSAFFYKKGEANGDENKDNNQDKSLNVLLNLSTLGSIMYCFTSAISEFYRISLYFSIFNILLLPNALKECKDRKEINIIKKILIILFLGYFFTRTIFNTGIYPYTFM